MFFGVSEDLRTSLGICSVEHILMGGAHSIAAPVKFADVRARN
jgi:hypothetical protein